MISSTTLLVGPVSTCSRILRPCRKMVVVFNHRVPLLLMCSSVLFLSESARRAKSAQQHYCEAQSSFHGHSKIPQRIACHLCQARPGRSTRNCTRRRCSTSVT